MQTKYKAIINTFILIAIDAISYYTALLFSILTRENIPNVFSIKNIPTFSFSYSYFASIWWIPAIFIIVLCTEKMYASRLPFWEEAKRLIKSVSITMVLVLLVVVARNIYGTISRTVFLFLWIYLIFLSPTFRYIGKKILLKYGIFVKPVIVIGSGKHAISSAIGITNEKNLGYDIISILSIDPEQIGTSIIISEKPYVIGSFIKDFEMLIKKHKIETVIVAIQNIESNQSADLINKIFQSVKCVIIIPNITGISIINSELYHLFMEKLLMINVSNHLNNIYNRIIKKTFDFFASIIITILLSPVFIIIAILIKLGSNGPAFYSSARVGKNGKDIKIYKFRTMYLGAEDKLKEILEKDPIAKSEWDKYCKLKNDPRVTKIGNFLRKTSLDELPQLFNVIKCEMSLVGPRPAFKEEIERYHKENSKYYYSVLPGITGLWQISGRSNKDFTFRVQMDEWYVKNWSMWLDIIILIKTIAVVLNREGAY